MHAERHSVVLFKGFCKQVGRLIHVHRHFPFRHGFGTAVRRNSRHSVDDIEETDRYENNTEQFHKTATNVTKLDRTPKLGGRKAHSTTFTANTEVHGGHQAGARVTVQLLYLATGAELWRRLERQEG